MQTFSQRIPLYQKITCLTCAILAGFIIWRMTIDSDAVITSAEQFIRLGYILLTACSYFGALWATSRYCNMFRREAIPGLLFVSIFGTSLPFVVSTVQIWFTKQLEFAWFDRASALLLVNLIMLFSMVLFAGTGFVVSQTFRAVGRVIKQRQRIQS